MFSPTKGCVFAHDSYGWSGLSETNLSISQNMVMCSMYYLERVRTAVPALQGAPKEKEREGLAMGVSTQSIVCMLTLVLPLFVFPCVFVSEAPPDMLVTMQCWKRVFKVSF